MPSTSVSAAHTSLTGLLIFSWSLCHAVLYLNQSLFQPCAADFVLCSMCFYGLTSPAEGPTRYVRCLQHVFHVYQQMEPLPPLVVNTMGWNEGVCTGRQMSLMFGLWQVCPCCGPSFDGWPSHSFRTAQAPVSLGALCQRMTHTFGWRECFVGSAKLERKKIWNRMTASVLKEDPNTKRFKWMLIYFNTDANFRGSKTRTEQTKSPKNVHAVWPC